MFLCRCALCCAAQYRTAQYYVAPYRSILLRNVQYELISIVPRLIDSQPRSVYVPASTVRTRTNYATDDCRPVVSRCDEPRRPVLLYCEVLLYISSCSGPSRRAATGRRLAMRRHRVLLAAMYQVKMRRTGPSSIALSRELLRSARHGNTTPS